MTTTAILNTTPRRRLAAIAAALAVGSLGVGAFHLGSSSGEQGPLSVERVEFAAVTDFGDARRLVGFAEDVFFGEVLDAGKTSDGEPLPQTDYQVQVVDTIKGDAAGVVTVTQEGGYVAERNELRLMEGDTLIEPGHVYLFATRSDPNGRHFVVPEFGDVKVRSKAHQAELHQRASEAKGRQIAFDHKS